MSSAAEVVNRMRTRTPESFDSLADELAGIYRAGRPDAITAFLDDLGLVDADRREPSDAKPETRDRESREQTAASSDDSSSLGSLWRLVQDASSGSEEDLDGIAAALADGYHRGDGYADPGSRPLDVTADSSSLRAKSRSKPGSKLESKPRSSEPAYDRYRARLYENEDKLRDKARLTEQILDHLNRGKGLPLDEDSRTPLQQEIRIQSVPGEIAVGRFVLQNDADTELDVALSASAIRGAPPGASSKIGVAFAPNPVKLAARAESVVSVSIDARDCELAAGSTIEVCADASAGGRPLLKLWITSSLVSITTDSITTDSTTAATIPAADPAPANDMDDGEPE